MIPYNPEPYLKDRPADLRAEVVARELEDCDTFAGCDIVPLPQGSFGRAVSRDVGHVEIQHHPLTDEPYLILGMSREGFTDMIPPGMIFQPEVSRGERTTGVMLESAELYETEFQHTRQFMAPFDIAMARQRIRLEQTENAAATDPYRYFGNELFYKLWPDTTLEPDERQLAVLLDLTLKASRFAGDFDFCEKALERLLNYSAKISYSRSISTKTEIGSLGDVTLGTDWIPFGRMPDPMHVEIALGPIPSDRMVDFRYQEPYGKQYQMVRFLCDLLFPVEYSWSLNLVPGEGGFQIGRKNDAGILGYSTILG